jgi:hypothetical protein
MYQKSVSVAAALILGAVYSGPALAQQAMEVNDRPLTENWSPSEWGPDDKAGAVNRTTAAMVLKAVKLVKQGKTATLGKVYQQDAPAFGSRGWRMTIPGLPTGGPFGPQKLVYNDEYLSTEIGQIGTQFDGPGHIGVITSKGNYFYNGRYTEDADVGTYGMGPLGVEFVAQKGFVCRGVLLDAVALRGGQLPIPVENKAIRASMRSARVTACFSTPVTATSGTRRIGTASTPPRKPSVSANSIPVSRASDFRPASIWPNARSSSGVRNMMTKNGIWNLENMDLSQLVADKAYEFLFAWSPLKIKGGTGSPGNPIAVY